MEHQRSPKILRVWGILMEWVIVWGCLSHWELGCRWGSCLALERGWGLGRWFELVKEWETRSCWVRVWDWVCY